MKYIDVNCPVQQYDGTPWMQADKVVTVKDLLITELGRFKPDEKTNAIDPEKVWKLIQKVGTYEGESGFEDAETELLDLLLRLNHGGIPGWATGQVIKMLKNAPEEPSETSPESE